MPPEEDPRLTALHRLRLRASNCYLLRHDGVVVIDSGLRGETDAILRAMGRKGMRPADLRLILLTHGHFDHAGGAARLAAATGAPVALHAADAILLRFGQEVPAPPIIGWARTLSRMLSIGFVRSRMTMGAYSPDIVIGDEDFSLLPYGVPGKVIHTPGHTAGSVSVLLQDGRAIVGDLAMNGFPSLRSRPAPPIVAQDPSELLKSWRMLCERGATTIYPGHGAPFPSESMQMIP